MSDTILGGTEVQLVINGKALTQDKDKEDPEFSSVGASYQLLKRSNQGTPELNDGDKVLVVVTAWAAYWSMPSNELRSTQAVEKATGFKIEKCSGSSGTRIQFGDEILFRSTESDNWIGLTLSLQQLQGWPARDRASQIQLLIPGTTTHPVPDPDDLISQAWCIQWTNHDQQWRHEEYYGTKSNAEKRRKAIADNDAFGGAAGMVKGKCLPHQLKSADSP